MYNRIEVREALRRSREADSSTGIEISKNPDRQDSIISLLIHDLFGGEILKTHKKNGWHFYNRINGERFDFSKSEPITLKTNDRFDDLPTTTDEPCNNYEMDDYSTFFTRFITAFEETIGLDKFKVSYED